MPRLAAAGESSLAIDFDSDGQRDHVVLDHREPSILQVWLSVSDTTQVIHTRVPLLRVIATDLDGDHRPELVASDRELRIHVWTRKRTGFHTYRPRHEASHTLNEPNSRRVNDNDRELAGVLTSPTFALALCASPHAPALESARAPGSHTARGCGSSTAADPFAPRPPPTHRLPL